jgi:uncharacterized phage infection (PIP) family protein YhgE
MTDTADRMLSQAEIDALLSGNIPAIKPPPSGGAPSPMATATPEPKSAPRAAEPEPIPPAPPQVSTLSEDLGSIHKSIKDLTSRLSRIENAIIRLEQLEKKINNNNTAPNQSALIKKLESKIEEIESGLSDSLSYKIRRKFECGHCHTKGFVAVNVRCTKCGKETWSGWYPKKPQGK